MLIWATMQEIKKAFELGFDKLHEILHLPRKA